MNIIRTARLFALLMTFLLPACGGGGGSSSGGGSSVGGSSTGTGVFLDSAVEGISYVSGSVSGVTDVNGTFTYEVGNTVTFTIGDIVIGETLGQAVTTPVELVTGSDATYPTVVNIARFLQTVDDDGDPTNGIQITGNVRNLGLGKTINFAQSMDAFSADGAVQTIISELTFPGN